MTVVAVLSQKGGVGKTTVTLGMAEAARRSGIKTLVVDLDPQANATDSLTESTPDFTINDVLADGRPGIASQAVVPSSWGPGLDLIASDQALEHRNREGARASAKRLRTTLGDLRSSYDLVLIDCPPSIGELTVNALTAADRAVTVTEPGFYALRGAEQALQAITVVRDSSNLSLRSSGIIINRYRAQLREHEHRLAELESAYPTLVLHPVLPERSIIAAASGAGRPVQAYRSKQARELSNGYLLLVRAVAGLREPTMTEAKN